MKKLLFFLAIFALACNSSQSQVTHTKTYVEQDRVELLNYLKSICDWALDSEVGSGELKIQAKRRTSVFINSNLARVLIAGYELTGEKRYLDEALTWFDRLITLQQITETPDGKKAGYWGDFNPDGNIYLGDAGTTTTALAGAIRFADGVRKANYERALQLYANFVQFGTKEDPQGKGRGGSNGWIIQTGEHAGAIGCGYYKGALSTAPYTISTSVTGAAFFSCYYSLTNNEEYLHIAQNAVNWLLNNVKPTGEFPYILHNSEQDSWPLDTMSYVADGIVGVYMRSNDEEFKKQVVSKINRSLQWLLNEQNSKGTWGKLRSEDQQRSQGILNLLVWYYDEVSKNPKIFNSIHKNYSYFLNPKKSQQFGVRELPITTGFVGLGIAEVLEPGITYRLK